MIYKILINKQSELLAKGDPFAVSFTAKEINILSDLNELRSLKLSTPFPSNWKPSDDLFDCANTIINGGHLYYILEFCMLRNKVLENNISKVFSSMRRSHDK